jgi:hypothetical protein
MSRAPAAGASANLLQFIHDCRPCTVVLGRIGDISLVNGQAPSHPSKGAIVEETTISVSQLVENLQHRIGIPEFRQRSIGRAQSPRSFPQALSIVCFHQLKQHANLLQALACLVNRIVRWRVGTA